jgi:hypothetical protein
MKEHAYRMRRSGGKGYASLVFGCGARHSAALALRYPAVVVGEGATVMQVDVGAAHAIYGGGVEGGMCERVGNCVELWEAEVWDGGS